MPALCPPHQRHGRRGRVQRYALYIKYNQYESFVLPILSCLEGHGVKVTYNTTVTDIRFDCKDGKKTATQITTLRDGKEEPIALTENDFVFTTLGSNVENSTLGTHHSAPALKFENGAGFQLVHQLRF